MFDFLKKKLKLFEKNIEAEIESELKKDEKLEKRLDAESQKQPIKISSPVPSGDIPSTTPVIKEEENLLLFGNERSVLKNMLAKKKRNEISKLINRLRKALKVNCNVFCKLGKVSKKQYILRKNHRGQLTKRNSMSYFGI